MKQLGVDVLAEVPILEGVSRGGDIGRPVAASLTMTTTTEDDEEQQQRENVTLEGEIYRTIAKKIFNLK